MQRVQCPVCNQDGVLQWKETVTKVRGKEYRYRKLYVYHQHPKQHPEKHKWCYLNKGHLQTLGITQNKESLTQSLTQNRATRENLNLRLKDQNKLENEEWAGSLARLGHLLDVQKVAGSNPVRPTNTLTHTFNTIRNTFQTINIFVEEEKYQS